MKFEGPQGAMILLKKLSNADCALLSNSSASELSILWERKGSSTIEIDGIPHRIEAEQMLFLTEFHKVKPIDISELHLLRFNRSFYCIVDHDYEISCKGLLFFGASTVPEIRLTPDVIQKFELLWSAFEMEMQEQDNLQVEMLQMMLKRFIILCTRIYKAQSDYHTMQQADQDIIREFNYLVEKHYRSLHKVSDYAALLHKSPKTLSNLFANRAQTPLQLIQNRKLLEAKRMLHYSSESVKEIAFELGFQETTTFSRFFKAQTGISPKTYREKSKSGKTVNS